MKTRRWLSQAAVTMSLALCMALVGCGGSGAPSGSGADATSDEEIVEVEEGVEEETEAVDQAAVEPAANVAPDDIDPGSLDQENTSDLWWPNGDKSGECLYFTNAANDAGKTVTFAFGDDETSIWEVQIEDGHLVPGEEAERAFDIVFIDNFTCYDYATETLYVRGDMSQADYEAALVGSYALNPDDPSEDTFTLMEDGTLIQTFKGTDYEGTWSVINTTEVCFDFGTYDDAYEFALEGGVGTAIIDGSNSFERI